MSEDDIEILTKFKILAERYGYVKAASYAIRESILKEQDIGNIDLILCDMITEIDGKIKLLEYKVELFMNGGIQCLDNDQNNEI